MFPELETKPLDFDALRLKLASPERIREWSHGEVTKAETVNYRTQKPEKDGLFDERIFGPSKDWECYCGKYKKVRYKGIVCDKCGVEVTRSVVRRERMGHIELAAPVTHIWFLRGVPSRIGLMLDLSLQNLEKVVYFASFIITKVDEDLKKSTLEQIRQEYKAKRRKLEEDAARQAASVRQQVAKAKAGAAAEVQAAAMEAEAAKIQKLKVEQLQELDGVLRLAEAELRDLKPLKIISEHQYQDLSLKYGHIFEAGIGAEAVRQLLEEIDLHQLIEQLQEKLVTAHGPQRDKLTKRLRLASDLVRNKIRPEWQVLTTIPVIPPDLRPMVPLDGGRFATSDLNDLYRRIINRNNRLKQLVELNAPEVICRNEKRMLQEAVDALVDNNARHGKTVVASTGQKRMLKSLADILRGKQGRFRQNLLGKRIDYSGRSVIVVGPKLKLHQCGLPKRMALELFKPFIISRIIKAGYVHNVRSASRFIESGRAEVWDILEDIVRESYVLLNRAPTLHRLGIQAFKPTLIEGKAIQVHPLVCSAFNADFDGDQMAVHVPLTEEAKREAAEMMLSTRNLLKPATGAPITNPTMDMVWGCYYMTMALDGVGAPKVFASVAEAYNAYQLRCIRLQEKIQIRVGQLNRTLLDAAGKKVGKLELVTTTMGRMLFNEVLPADQPYVNSLMDKKALAKLVGTLLERSTFEEVAATLDKIKEFGFRYLTRSGFSWGMDDVPELSGKREIIAQGDREVAEVNEQYEMGLLTDSERHTKVIETWMKIKDDIVAISRQALDPTGPIYTMVESGARGSWSQLIQIMGMKGLVTNPAGEIIELPVKGNFKEGFDVLEYFISTHGARKGLSDTALRTANAGYLTRRLVDVAQDLVITSEDCGDREGSTFSRADSQQIGLNLIDRVINRFSLQTVVPPRGRKPILQPGDLITPQVAETLRKLDLPEIHVRSVLNCKNRRGVCQQCYGYDLGYNQLVRLGTAVGIIAAQSIGEPGTQLTMRTFHTGGVAGLDITQGLPRVEEIFEARIPKVKAFVSEVAGTVTMKEVNAGSRQKVVQVAYTEVSRDFYPLGESKPAAGRGRKKSSGAAIKVKDSQAVEAETVLAQTAAGEKILAKRPGVVQLEPGAVAITVQQPRVKEYIISPEFTLTVGSGDLVAAGDRISDGSLDLRQLHRLKGMAETQRYVLREIQSIYTSQGQQLNDKHVELIIRQMFSRVQVRDPGATELLPGSRLEWAEFTALRDQMVVAAKAPPEGDRLLMGITKVSLSTSSFLSAASFQETSRVLINAAVQGRIDILEGLKENVIIGRLIPAGTGFRFKPAPVGVASPPSDAAE